MLSEQEQKTDSSQFWKFITQNLRTLLVFSAIGAIAAFTITFFIPKEYKSYGVVFPPSSTSIDNSIDFPNFGYDIEADRLIQILESSEIRDAVIKKFGLDTYYEIDKGDADWLDQLMKKYYKNIKFERTPSMSILVSARTKSPQLSSDIVNFIINSADELREKIYKKNIIPAYENARLDYETQQHLVDSVEAQLTRKLEENHVSGLLMLMSDAQISIDLDKLTAGTAGSSATLGTDIIAFKSMYDILKEYKSRYIKVKKTYMNPIPKLYVINYAEPSYKKVFPSFSANMAVGILFALFVTIVVLLIRHSSESR